MGYFILIKWGVIYGKIGVFVTITNFSTTTSGLNNDMPPIFYGHDVITDGVKSCDGEFSATFQSIIAFVKYLLGRITSSALETSVNNAFSERSILYICHVIQVILDLYFVWQIYTLIINISKYIIENFHFLSQKVKVNRLIG